MKDRQMGEVFIAYNTALSHILFEEFESAERVMRKIDWERKIPMYQAAVSLNIRAFIHYYHTGDCHEGLSLMRKAKALATVSGSFPGSKQAEMTYEAYIAIGQLLTGFRNDEVVAALEKKFDQLPILPKLFIASGLRSEYKRSGQVDKLLEKEAFLRSNAPYCKLLLK
ncbi:hypothetical protein [Paenibacillus sp. NEAU-GSW1]|uniref:hypothetical protein n=1 Tax=Paenibacillus sp. NEAU-GSW1 TaxID=2682486 RepID=UPI001C12B53B|nr:hypothetical protein [Paenibacillus sp. NEAU-GSW1]